MRRTVATILAVATLTAVATTGLPVGPAAASTRVADRTTGHSSTGHGAAAPTHRNPVALSLPDGETAASCADPTAIRGVGRDRNWYLYCTTDALTATEQNADGSLVQHGVPTYRSTDLTHWTYVNDAFPTRPAWVGAANGIWAPDVVYRAGDRGRAGTWYLYYAASDTPTATAPTGGGSAVGVATSSSPTGPWKDSGGPVVAPQTAANGTGARWAFDPEVISDKGTTYLYFGSYFGGVNVRTLSADGLRSDPASERQIAIDNRYEGAYLMRHDGWWYFMGSATNCCNGALTGYGVFVARSRSPSDPSPTRTVSRSRAHGSAGHPCSRRTATAGSAPGTTRWSPTSPARTGSSTTRSTAATRTTRGSRRTRSGRRSSTRSTGGTAGPSCGAERDRPTRCSRGRSHSRDSVRPTGRPPHPSTCPDGPSARCRRRSTGARSPRRSAGPVNPTARPGPSAAARSAGRRRTPTSTHRRRHSPRCCPNRHREATTWRRRPSRWTPLPPVTA
ncbi:family 43 glycosylhydrolase [Curtobacterium sp. 24E2]|nr:family 43 glycosylhydrolase [Curtobacterium sp. 24E2]